MSNININEFVPDTSNLRHIILEPYYMEDIGDDFQGIEVYLNGKKHTKGKLVDRKKHLFHIDINSQDCAIIHVKIVVNKGKLRIGPGDAYGVYPAVYDNIQGKVTIKQQNFVHWMQQPSLKDIDSRLLKEGDVFEYYHLIPQSPSFLSIYFNKEKHREEFIKTKTLSKSSMENIMISPKYDYFPDLSAFQYDIDELTQKILIVKGKT